MDIQTVTGANSTTFVSIAGIPPMNRFLANPLSPNAFRERDNTWHEPCSGKIEGKRELAIHASEGRVLLPSLRVSGLSS